MPTGMRRHWPLLLLALRSSSCWSRATRSPR